MAKLIVRNLDEALVRELEQRAAREGRSSEAEHRRILEEALRPGRPERTLKELLLDMPDVGEDDDFARIDQPPREVVQ